MTSLSQGTITFLFTDIEGSSRLWERFPEPMRLALAKHDTMLHEAAEACGGFVFKTIGDAFCVAFSTPHEALNAAVAAQRLLNNETWDETGALRVRMALHTGAAELRDQDYFGPALNRVSRLLNAAHGGQILLSLATAELVRDRLADGITLRDLGERRLRDLNRPERIFQILARDLPAEFPPLRSLEAVPNNLPAQLTSFIGREREMAEVKQRLNTTPLLTLTGTGGTGKTRLSLQAAADVLDQFEDGVWLVELATVSDPDLVPEAVAGVLGVREEPDQPLHITLTNFLRTKSLLLILDNCEHLVAAVAQLAEKLLRACPRLRILASSREALGIAGETVWPVPPLSLLDVWREKNYGPDAAEKNMRY
jgi:class 3 adenylate cyclase